MNKYQLIDHLQSLIRLIAEDRLDAARVSFSRDGDTYKVQFFLGEGRTVKVRELTEDGILARVLGFHIDNCPYEENSKEAICWKNGWTLEDTRRKPDGSGIIG